VCTTVYASVNLADGALLASLCLQWQVVVSECVVVFETHISLHGYYFPSCLEFCLLSLHCYSVVSTEDEKPLAPCTYAVGEMIKVWYGKGKFLK